MRHNKRKCGHTTETWEERRDLLSDSQCKGLREGAIEYFCKRNYILYFSYLSLCVFFPSPCLMSFIMVLLYTIRAT